MENILTYLRKTPYPGRGILLGKSPDGEHGVIVYFVMGRSQNSRNRVLEQTGDGIRTKAYDQTQVQDPSLILYNPVRRLDDGRIIVTNGDQTDTIRSAFLAGWTFEQALAARSFEPDGPNWTPRISGVLSMDGSYTLSIIKTLGGDPDCCCHFFFNYDKPPAGVGQFLSTYTGDGTPLPSYSGEPISVGVPQGSAQELADAMWDAMDKRFRVSLYAAWVNFASREIDSVILNENGSEDKTEASASE